MLLDLSTAIVVCDSDLNVFLTNPSAHSLLAISENQVLGTSILNYFQQKSTCELLNTILHTSQIATLRQVSLYDSHRRVHLVDCIVTPIVFDNSQHLILEINEVEAIAKKLEKDSVDIGQNTNNAVIQAVAHEIKNPLGGLRGAAQLLDRELGNSPHLHTYTEIIVKEADRLCALVDNMSMQEMPLNLCSLNVHQVLERVHALMLAEVPKSIRLVRDYDPSLPPIVGDQGQLIQAFLNLVRNSVEAVGNQGMITIRTRVERQATIGNIRYARAAKINILDDGCGISQNLIDKIFYPMISSKPKGEGLGLSIVHRIISRHGGAVTCNSTPGDTCFTVLLKFAE